MKCFKCQTENKEGVKLCKKCGSELNQPPLWKPSWKWHLKTLSIIYVVLFAAFIVLNIVLKPYTRKVPQDITPWLKDLPKTVMSNEK
jgi:hypothetical protein